MKIFEKYLERVKLSDDSERLLHQAYRLDGTHPSPDLCRDAKVGSCNCCDYFFFLASGTLVLIEDTRLGADIENREQRFRYLNSADLKAHVVKLICLENVLKVYGSLFTLYRFINQKSNLNLIPKIESIEFWFVGNDTDKPNTRVLNVYKHPLDQALSARLGTKVVDRVRVMTRSGFIERFESANKNHTFSGATGTQKSDLLRN